MGTGHRDYSATPLPTKLGVREGSRVLLIGAPEGFELGPLPPGAELLRAARGVLDVVVLFATTASALERRFGKLVAALPPAGRLWVAWPRQASGVATDLTFEQVQRLGLETGLVDNKSASIDGVFQGLQFVYRIEDRPKR